jgi:hypothetical protein
MMSVFSFCIFLLFSSEMNYVRFVECERERERELKEGMREGMGPQQDRTKGLNTYFKNDL